MIVICEQEIHIPRHILPSMKCIHNLHVKTYAITMLKYETNKLGYVTNHQNNSEVNIIRTKI